MFGALRSLGQQRSLGTNIDSFQQKSSVLTSTRVPSRLANAASAQTWDNLDAQGGEENAPVPTAPSGFPPRSPEPRNLQRLAVRQAYLSGGGSGSANKGSAVALANNSEGELSVSSTRRELLREQLMEAMGRGGVDNRATHECHGTNGSTVEGMIEEDDNSEVIGLELEESGVGVCNILFAKGCGDDDMESTLLESQKPKVGFFK